MTETQSDQNDTDNDSNNDMDLERIPVLYSQDRYNEWIETLAENEVETLVGDEGMGLDPEDLDRDSVQSGVEWSGTISSFSFSGHFYQIAQHAHSLVPETEVTLPDDDVYGEMESLGHHVVCTDVAQRVQEILEEEFGVSV